MIMGGVWSCRWRELRPISFGTGAGSGTEAKRREAGGEYEMVGMDEEEGDR